MKILDRVVVVDGLAAVALRLYSNGRTAPDLVGHTAYVLRDGGPGPLRPEVGVPHVLCTTLLFDLDLGHPRYSMSRVNLATQVVPTSALAVVVPGPVDVARRAALAAAILRDIKDDRWYQGDLAQDFPQLRALALSMRPNAKGGVEL